MDPAFYVEAMNMLLGLSNLTREEHLILTFLHSGAKEESYWDCLSRLRASNDPDAIDAMIYNICCKAKVEGLQPQLEALKAKHMEVENVRKTNLENC
jgi:hypothetical protein